MEHNHGGLFQIIFLSKWLISRFQPLIFQGVHDFSLAPLISIFKKQQHFFAKAYAPLGIERPRNLWQNEAAENSGIFPKWFRMVFVDIPLKVDFYKVHITSKLCENYRFFLSLIFCIHLKWAPSRLQRIKKINFPTFPSYVPSHSDWHFHLR